MPFAPSIARLAALAVVWSAATAMPLRPYFKHLPIDGGIGANRITSITQDQVGFLWLGTESGLFRYDGAGFLRYSNRADDAASLGSDFVASLLSDSRNRLWVGLENSGVSRLDPASGTFEQFDTGFAAGADSQRVHRVIEDPSGSVWLTTMEGLSRFNETAQRFEAVDTGLRVVYDLTVDASGAYWIGSGRGLHRYDPGTGRTTLAVTDSGQQLSEAVWEVRPGPRGGLWAGTIEHGLIRFDPDRAQVVRYEHDPHDPATLSNNEVNALRFDDTGMLWVATYDGLNLLDPSTGAIQRISTANRNGSVRHPYVRHLFSDRDGMLWVGTYGAGALMLPAQWRNLSHWSHAPGEPDSLPSPDVYAAMQAHDGSIWVGTYTGHLSRIAPQENRVETFGPAYSAHRIWDLAEADSAIWLATNDGLMRCCGEPEPFRRYLADRQGTTPPNDVWAVERAPDGRIWVAIFGVGVAFLDSGEDRLVPVELLDADGNLVTDATDVETTPGGRILVSTYHHGLWQRAPDQSEFLPVQMPDPGAPVNVIAMDQDDRLWIGTRGNGLMVISEAGDQRIRSTSGLPSDTINGLQADRDGHVWVATDNGLAKVNSQSLDVVRLTGLPDRQINHHALSLTPEGSLLIGTRSGLYFVKHGYFGHDNTDPPVVVSDIFVAHERIGDGSRGGELLDLPHFRNELRFEYRVLDYLAAGMVRYRHRLTGLQEDWQSSQGHASYTNLPPGDFWFEFQAQLPDGRWIPGTAAVGLHIRPAPWQSNLAYTAYGAVFLVMIWLLYSNVRARRRAEHQEHAAVRRSKERLDLALWGSGDWLWDWEPNRGLAYCPELAERLGIPDRDGWLVVQQVAEAVADPLARETFRREGTRMEETGQCDVAAPFVNSEGSRYWLRFRGRVVERDSEDNILRATGTCRDISDWKDAETRLRLAARILENSRDAVAILDLDSRFIQVNRAFERITGYTQSEVIGQPATLLNSDREDEKLGDQIRRELQVQGDWSGEIWERRKDGTLFLSMIHISAVRDDDGHPTHWVAVFTDITRRRKSEEELRYLTNYDSLTGLPNRTLFDERLNHALARSRRRGQLIVLYINIDGFTGINESMGHGAGDLLLRKMANRFAQHVGEGDTVARLGGDEFAAIIEYSGELKALSGQARALLAAAAEPVDLGDAVIKVSASIGVALFPDHGRQPAELIRHAHTALRAAKRRGSGRYEVYDPGMSEAAADRMQVALALSEAHQDGSLVLHYQPKIDMETGQVSGMEALLRWRNPLGELIGPDSFIPVAEERGLITEIGRWALDTACRELCEIDRQVSDELTLAVNLSARQMDDEDLVETVARTLDRWSIKPGRLRLELTESVVMETAGRSVKMLRSLKKLGVMLVMDDFGTGYSSLSYLNHLPLDQLKIDKSFIRHVEEDRVAAAIVRAVLSMAGDLGLVVTAEGVERPEQLQFLRRSSCREVQGFLFSEPLPLEELVRFLQSPRKRLEGRATGPEHTGSGPPT